MVEQLKIPIWNQIPLTRIRIIVARVLYRMLHMVLKTDFHTIHRNHVCYAVDLSEGIDMTHFYSEIFKIMSRANNIFTFPMTPWSLTVGRTLAA